jgi:prolyl-tRNA synthetase
MTLAIEAMMQDRKSQQAGTSHFLGQNFSRAQEIKFQDQQGQEQFAWTTSWGVSTRLVGALIMTHSDDDGLVLPPRVAPQHAVILPIYRNDEERAQVLPYCENVKRELEQQSYDGAPLRVAIDDRDLRGGEKNWQHVKRGVPLRLEIGPKDLAKDSVFTARRDTGEKRGVARGDFVATAGETLRSIQDHLYARALALRDANTRTIDDLGEFRQFFTPADEQQNEIHGGFALCHLADEHAADEVLKELKVTIRCLPLNSPEEDGRCPFSGRPSRRRALFAKAY